MTERALSEKLCEIACKMNEWIDSVPELSDLANELHTLSEEKFTPGSTSWSDLKAKKGQTSKKKPRYLNNPNNRELPF